MAYERSLITETNSAIPTQPAIIMREEREVDHRATSRPQLKTVSRETTGQSNINSSEKVASEAPPAAEETVTLSPQLAALARKEQRYRQNEQALKAKEVALEAERKEIAELKALKAKLEAKDFSGIEGLVKYDDYTQYLIDKTESVTPEQKALRELTEKITSVEKAHKDDVEKRFEAAVNERRKAVTQLVATSPDYSSIKELKAEEHVVRHILDTWEHDGIDLSPEDAAKEVEKALLEQAGKWASLPKLKQGTGSSEESQKELPPLKPAIKTLTNNMAATGEIKRVVKSFQNMSDTERYAEARRRAEEKLKQTRG